MHGVRARCAGASVCGVCVCGGAGLDMSGADRGAAKCLVHRVGAHEVVERAPGFVHEVRGIGHRPAVDRLHGLPEGGHQTDGEGRPVLAAQQGVETETLR